MIITIVISRVNTNCKNVVAIAFYDAPNTFTRTNYFKKLFGAMKSAFLVVIHDPLPESRQAIMYLQNEEAVNYF